MSPGEETRSERAAFRAWVRAHHPDLGGDPEAFAAGLRRRGDDGRARADTFPDAPVVGVHRRHGPVAAVLRWRYRRRRARRLR
ncbi:hypothetical protein DZF91_05090 [Actinomadura logoneensis]|uniref:Uncharacterized protein n=1 Tax=Actinomadura logoneensis TaxID=2293572 RepID=A0A372JRR9_9ACTN|nr:hypothetical protein [Actinomadura logoneensis]RFU42712.1 hypothetical protein DZF91_05090 [Actinomadura logoneensis]